MSAVLGKNDWKRLKQECSQIATDFFVRSSDVNVVGLTEALVTGLREAGWLVRENVVRPARHKDSLVGEYNCPILVNEQAVIIPMDVLPIEALSLGRLNNVRETVGLSAAIMVSLGGAVISDLGNR